LFKPLGELGAKVGEMSFFFKTLAFNWLLMDKNYKIVMCTLSYLPIILGKTKMALTFGILGFKSMKAKTKVAFKGCLATQG
jgi:hypothetical protein